MKRIISIFIAMLTLSFAFPVFAAQNDLTWEKAVLLMDSENPTLMKLTNAEKQTARQYVDATISAQGVKTDGMHVTFMGREMYIAFDNYTKMLLTQQKELVPEQMQLSWDMSKSNLKVTRNSLIVALRGIYAGLYSAKCDNASKGERLKLADSLYKQAAIKYKSGLITDIDLEEAEYNLSKAEQEATSAARSLENAERTFNSFVGADVGVKYDNIEFSEKVEAWKIGDLDEYLSQGLKQRLEITSLDRQLALAGHKKTILEMDQVYQIYTAAMKDYANLLVEMDSLKTKQAKARLEVEKDIRNAYAEAVNAGKKVENMKKTLELQKSNLDSVTKKYQAGLISNNVLKQVELGYSDMELGYRMTVYDYNTKQIKLQYASGMGPGYGG